MSTGATVGDAMGSDRASDVEPDGSVRVAPGTDVLYGAFTRNGVRVTINPSTFRTQSAVAVRLDALETRLPPLGS